MRQLKGTFYNVKEVAKLRKCSPENVYRIIYKLINEGQLKTDEVFFNHHLLIDETTKDLILDASKDRGRPSHADA